MPDSRTAPHLEQVFSHTAMLAGQNPYQIGVYEVNARQTIRLHWHHAYEISYILKGTGTCTIEDTTFSIGPGQIVVINGNYAHGNFPDTHLTVFNIHFDPSLLEDRQFFGIDAATRWLFTMPRYRFLPVLPAHSPHTKQVAALLNAIGLEHTNASVGWPVVVKGLLLQVVGLLLRYFQAETPMNADTRRRLELAARLEPALELLERRLIDPPTVGELASTVALSPEYFSDLFREAFGQTPVAYRNTRRVLLARQALLDSSQSIAEIAYQCGFSTVQQFNRVFREVVGCEPRQFRQQAGAGMPQPRS